jgi:hypothetical protein
LAFLGYLVPLFGLFPDSVPATNLKTYFEKLKSKLPKHKTYLADAIKFWVPKT